jgi:hypothetical protein
MKFTIFATITTLLPGALSVGLGYPCGSALLYPCTNNGYDACVSADGSSSTSYCVRDTTDATCNDECARVYRSSPKVYAYQSE